VRAHGGDHGKGLSDLIREEFGFRSTFFVMVTGLVDLANVVAELPAWPRRWKFSASVNTSRCRRSRCWCDSGVERTYRQVEIVFLIARFYLTYLFSALPILIDAGAHDDCSSIHWDTGYLVTLTASSAPRSRRGNFLLAGRIRRESGRGNIRKRDSMFCWAASVA
jgi:hypothetical protein